MTVIGTKHGSFTDKRTGEAVSYGRIYVTYPFPKTSAGGAPEGVQGGMCEELKVPVDTLEGVHVGDEVSPVYNRYGRIESVQKVVGA